MIVFGSAAKRIWPKIALSLLICAAAWGQPALANAEREAALENPLSLGANFKLGKQVYQSSCAGCHDTGVNRAPQKFELDRMRPDAIYKALTDGVMRSMASGLGDTEKIAVSEFLAGRRLSSTAPQPKANTCAGPLAQFDRSKPPAFSGWGLDRANTHGIPSQKAGLHKADVSKLKLKWAYGFPDSARIRSQPSLGGGAIFIGGQNGIVRALDRETGCERWRFEAAAEVRTAVILSPWEADDENADPLAFFADQAGNAYAIRAFTGELVWKKRMDEHPVTVITASPTLYGGQLFVPVSSLEEAAAANPHYLCCTFRGSVVALDPATGKENWRTYMVGEPQRIAQDNGAESYGPSGVAVWNTPAIDPDRGVLYVATGDNYSEPATELSDAIVALDLKTGAIAWHYQATKGDAWNVACYFQSANCPDDEGPDFDFGAATILVPDVDGRDLVLAGQKSGIAYAIDADNGKVVWQTRLGRGGLTGGILFGIAAIDGKLFAPISDYGEHDYSKHPPSPGLYAVDIASGKLIWESPAKNVCTADLPVCDPGMSGAITATPELVFSGAHDGHFRIYAADTGAVLLDLDLKRRFETVNGVAATGGAMGGGAAPIADDGQLIIASGYGPRNMAGNVLLVYEAE
ncbi:MAG: PQQ-binding-like beta-propeller repeat protein [Sphingomonadaceae bacterium]|nr:PQQ-binding-like beta-propeller repeat protein [Sphingomonadaceae bacterium]